MCKTVFWYHQKKLYQAHWHNFATVSPFFIMTIPFPQHFLHTTHIDCSRFRKPKVYEYKNIEEQTMKLDINKETNIKQGVLIDIVF